MQMEFILGNYPCIGSERYSNAGSSDINSDISPNTGNATYHVGDVDFTTNIGGADVAKEEANIGASAQNYLLEL